MAFIKGRQIVDGPLIVNEIIAWAKKHKKRLMFLKVDFEKAFDSLSWPFLFSIMEQVGFSREWIIWIRSSLNVEILEATENNIFKAINVGKDKIQVSHLQFMDDALILGDKLFGNWVSNIELNVVASSLGCLASEFPCSYLGLPIGSQMSRRSSINLKVFVEGSFGVGTRIKKKSHGSWKIVTLPRKSGGLGIGSLMDSNQSLLAKWWWRFRKEENALWCKVIRSIHGSSGGMLNTRDLKKSSAGGKSVCGGGEDGDMVAPQPHFDVDLAG
ncbi:putative RNA-directed DNA polymerase, eukaryota, reverse transcriptase zinc-binding domain protein [Tanacetum coccineum]